jgi:hypothetical protein
MPDTAGLNCGTGTVLRCRHLVVRTLHSGGNEAACGPNDLSGNPG